MDNIKEVNDIEEVNDKINIDLLEDILANISSDSDDNIEQVLNKKELFEKYVNKSVKDLRKILIDKELPLSGNKTTLVNRILDNL